MQNECRFAADVAIRKVSCQYPEDSGVSKRVQERDVINLQIAQDIQKLFAISVPIRSGRFMNYFPKNLYLFFTLLLDINLPVKTKDTFCLIKVYC